MQIALIQQTASPDTAANLYRALAAIESVAARGAELVAFAELAFEPFYPRERACGTVANLAEPIPGPTTNALAEAARRHGGVIVSNLYKRDGEHCYGVKSCHSSLLLFQRFSSFDQVSDSVAFSVSFDKEFSTNDTVLIDQKRARVWNAFGLAFGFLVEQIVGGDDFAVRIR